ncbi:hypothetical protein Ddc_16041 [Ditylenchus destructor]|nr:hypothetical protein Ddc_16041 [Ditylenchus destructor]
MESTEEEDREAAMQELQELERNIEEIPKLLVWTCERIDRIKDLLMSNPGMVTGDRNFHSDLNTTPHCPPEPARPTRAMSPEPLDSATMMKWKTFFAPNPNAEHSNEDKDYASADTTDCMTYPANDSYDKANPLDPHHPTADNYFQAAPTSKPSTSNDPYNKMNPNANEPIVDYRFFGNPSTVPTTSNESNNICNTNEPSVSPPLFSKPGAFNFGNLWTTSEKPADKHYFYNPESAPALPRESKSKMVSEQEPPKRYPDEIFVGCSNQLERRQAKDLYQSMNPHLFPRLPIHRRIVVFKKLADQGRLVGPEAAFELMRLERFRNLARDGSPAKHGEPTMLDWIVENVERYDAEENAWEEMQQSSHGQPPEAV